MSTYRRVNVHPRPADSRRTPTGQDYEESPRHNAAARPHDSTARTNAHAHAHAQGHGPACEPWLQLWTHTQLQELPKWVCAEPFPEGLVHWPRRESTEGRVA